jgi:hypothetical protein
MGWFTDGIKRVIGARVVSAKAELDPDTDIITSVTIKRRGLFGARWKSSEKKVDYGGQVVTTHRVNYKEDGTASHFRYAERPTANHERPIFYTGERVEQLFENYTNFIFEQTPIKDIENIVLNLEDVLESLDQLPSQDILNTFDIPYLEYDPSSGVFSIPLPITEEDMVYILKKAYPTQNNDLTLNSFRQLVDKASYSRENNPNFDLIRAYHQSGNSFQSNIPVIHITEIKGDTILSVMKKPTLPSFRSQENFYNTALEQIVLPIRNVFKYLYC